MPTDINIAKVAAGYYHTSILTSDGLLYTFGRNDYGQCGLGHKEKVNIPHVVSSLKSIPIVQISCGCYHSVALGENGRVYPFGRNTHGQLGTKNNIDSTLPSVIESLRDVKVDQIAAGFYHTLCLSISNSSGSYGMKERILSSDLSILINNENNSDIVFLVDGKTIFAHRCVVASRCEPLASLLYGGMKESKMKEIEIPEVHHQVLFIINRSSLFSCIIFIFYILCKNRYFLH